MSRPTMSHHVHALREAGLLEEVRGRAGVLLALRRDVLERLSEATIARLFTDRESNPALTTTRRRR